MRFEGKYKILNNTIFHSMLILYTEHKLFQFELQILEGPIITMVIESLATKNQDKIILGNSNLKEDHRKQSLTIPTKPQEQTASRYYQTTFLYNPPLDLSHLALFQPFFIIYQVLFSMSKVAIMQSKYQFPTYVRK